MFHVSKTTQRISLQSQKRFQSQEKLKAAKSPEDVVGIAKEAGFMISADDLENAQSEVSDAELEGAAGGIICTYISAIELISKAGGTCRKNLPLGF